MRCALLALTTLFIATLSHAKVDCKKAMTTLDINACAQADFEVVEKKLNDTYRRAMKSLSKPDEGLAYAEIKKGLIEAQRAWVAENWGQIPIKPKNGPRVVRGVGAGWHRTYSNITRSGLSLCGGIGGNWGQIPIKRVIQLHTTAAAAGSHRPGLRLRQPGPHHPAQLEWSGIAGAEA